VPVSDTQLLTIPLVESAVSNDEVKERTAIRVVTYLVKSNEIPLTVALSILGTMVRNGTGEKLRGEAFDALENLINQDSGMWSKFDLYDQVEILCLQAALSPGQHWRQENLNRLEEYSQKPVLGSKLQREAASKLLALSRDISAKNPQAVIDLLLSMPILLDDPDIIDQGVPLLCEAIKVRPKTKSGDVADYLKNVAEKKSREDHSRLRLYLASGLVHRLVCSWHMAAARRVALKMGRRPRCSSVTYRFRYAPSSRLCRRPILNATICQLHMRRCTSSWSRERNQSEYEFRSSEEVRGAKTRTM
jgi:hypothetical protein